MNSVSVSRLQNENGILQFQNKIKKIVKEHVGKTENIVFEEKISLSSISMKMYHSEHEDEQIEFIMFLNQFGSKEYKVVEHVSFTYYSVSYYDFFVKRYRTYIKHFLKKISKYVFIKRMINDMIEEKKIEKMTYTHQLLCKHNLYGMSHYIQQFLSNDYIVQINTKYLPYSSFHISVTNQNTNHKIYIRDEITHFTICLHQKMENGEMMSKSHFGKFRKICFYLQKYFHVL